MRKLGEHAFVARAVVFYQALSAIIAHIIYLPCIAILARFTACDLMRPTDDGPAIRGLNEFGKWCTLKNIELFRAAALADLDRGTA